MISQYIYDLLLDNDYVAVPGLGGFVCQYQSAAIDRQQSLISPPARTIAFNKALHQNDGLLVQHVVLKDLVSYKDAEDKVRDYVTQCNQQLNHIGSIQFPKIGRLYMDELKNIQFTPSYESLPLEDSFGLKNIVFIPISRRVADVSDENLQDNQAMIVEVPRAQKRWPYWIAASFASVFLVGSLWMNVGQATFNNVLTAGFFTGNTVKISTQQNSMEMDNQQIKSELLSNIPFAKKVQPIPETIEEETAHAPLEEAVQIYPIVVGAFKGPVTAEKYKTRLVEQGYDVETLVTSPNTFIKVVIRYSAASEEEALVAIRANVEKDAWVLN